MSFLEGVGKKGGSTTSPIQHHTVQVTTDTFWAEGQLESLGDPHLYINKDGLDFLNIQEVHLMA